MKRAGWTLRDLGFSWEVSWQVTGDCLCGRNGTMEMLVIFSLNWELLLYINDQWKLILWNWREQFSWRKFSKKDQKSMCVYLLQINCCHLRCASVLFRMYHKSCALIKFVSFVPLLWMDHVSSNYKALCHLSSSQQKLARQQRFSKVERR